MAEEVKNILTSLKQGQNSVPDTQALRARLTELEQMANDKEKACQELERSLQVCNTHLFYLMFDCEEIIVFLI